jgi:hypothetical protein
MKQFLLKTGLFFLPLLLLFIVSVLTPATPRASGSMLFADFKKDSLLQYTPSPRIIFIGGSNLSFGMNSQMIKDSLQLNPINTGITMGLSLQFMLKNALQHIKEGDIVVLAPEYSHFFKDYDCASEMLLREVTEVNSSKISMVSFRQFVSLGAYVPRYSLTKLDPFEYYRIKPDKIHGVDCYNMYGDSKSNDLPSKDYNTSSIIEAEYNPEVMEEIADFAKEVEAKKARFYFTFCAIEKKVFNAYQIQINQVIDDLAQYNLPVIGTADHYCLERSQLFDSPFHPTKDGAIVRTNSFIKDFRIKMKQEALTK